MATSVTLHLSVVAILSFSAVRFRIEGPAAAPQIEITTVSAEAIRTSTGDTELKAEDTLDTPDPANGDPSNPDGATFDLPKIRANRDSLFPFLTIGLSFLEHIDQTAVAAQGRLGNPLAGVSTNSAKPPLQLTEAAMQKVIDNAFTRRHRWQAFDEIKTLLSAHDPNLGQGPELMREYLDQNLLQPFCDGTARDPRFWAMLENASDHLAFIEFVRKYAWEHPTSRTTTELLFLLDELTQASRSTLLMMMGTRPADLTYTAAQTKGGLELASAIQHQYADWLEAHGLWPLEVVRARFDQVRLRILMTILESTPGGYRAGDARYLAGEVFVDLGNIPDAVAQWRQIDPDSGDSYYKAYMKIRENFINSDAPTAAELSRVLQREYGDWRMSAIERLRSLGMRCDRY